MYASNAHRYTLLILALGDSRAYSMVIDYFTLSWHTRLGLPNSHTRNLGENTISYAGTIAYRRNMPSTTSIYQHLTTLARLRASGVGGRAGASRDSVRDGLGDGLGGAPVRQTKPVRWHASSFWTKASAGRTCHFRGFVRAETLVQDDGPCHLDGLGTPVRARPRRTHARNTIAGRQHPR